MSEQSTRDEFVLGNKTDDLVDITVEICGKKTDKNPKYPRYLYDTYVDRIINCALDINEHVILANERKYTKSERLEHQELAKGKCKQLNHLIRLSKKKGWISEKEKDRWSKLVTYIYFSICNWINGN